MKNKAIFLDRDGTITKPGDHIYKIEDMEFLPKAIDGLKYLKSCSDYKLIIVTNQAGIAKGIFSEKDYFAFRSELHQRLGKNGIIFDAEYFCPHHKEGTVEKYAIDCNCRKPKSSMLIQAAKDFDLNLSKSWIIGDMEHDLLAGRNVGCRAIQVMTGEAKIPSPYAEFVARNLSEAAEFAIMNFCI
jgi:D-glycero-D-manno-heptose 1,7-bisphosphate phosphatase